MQSGNVIRPKSAEPYLERYIANKGLEHGMPVSGTFELTSRCNFNCRMCYVHSSNSSELEEKELSADEWIVLGKAARDSGTMFILLTGGDPLIRKDFPEIYTALIKMGILVSVNTNASLYNEEIRQLFNKYPPSRINVTLYGGSEETYKNLCRNSSYDKVVKNLRSMKADGLQVRLNVSLTPYNYSDMKTIDRISREIGLQAKAATYMYPPVRIGSDPGENSARFDPVRAGEIMAEWNALRDSRELALSRAEKIRLNQEAGLIENCSDVEAEGVRCRAGRSAFWITWDGRMLPCGTMDIDASYPLRDGFKVAWDQVRERTAAIRLPKECAACPERNNCHACASICKCETGSFSKKPDYICAMTKKLIKNTLRAADEISKEKNNDNKAGIH